MKTIFGLTAAVKQEHDLWQKLLLNSTSPVELRDVLIHLGVWLEITLARLEAACNGSDPIIKGWPTDLDHNSDADLDAINAWIKATHNNLTYREARDIWENRYQQLITLTEAIPEEDWFVTGKYSWLPGYMLTAVVEGSLEHHREHRESFNK